MGLVVNIVGRINIKIVLQHDPRDPAGPRLTYQGFDDAGQVVRPRTIKRLLRRVIKNSGSWNGLCHLCLLREAQDKHLCSECQEEIQIQQDAADIYNSQNIPESK